MIRRDIATIGISEDKIVILLTDDILDSEEKDSLTKLDSNDIIMIINENTSDKEIEDLQLFFIQSLLHGRRKRRQRFYGRYRFWKLFPKRNGSLVRIQSHNKRTDFISDTLVFRKFRNRESKWKFRIYYRDKRRPNNNYRDYGKRENRVVSYFSKQIINISIAANTLLWWQK